jgi:hypothetical protein
MVLGTKNTFCILQFAQRNTVASVQSELLRWSGKDPPQRDFTPYSASSLKTNAASGRREVYVVHTLATKQVTRTGTLSSQLKNVTTKWINLEQSGVFPGCFYLWKVTTCNLCRRCNWIVKAFHMSCAVWSETRRDWHTDSNEATFHLGSKSQSPLCLSLRLSKSSSHQSRIRLLKYGWVVWRFKIAIILSLLQEN